MQVDKSLVCKIGGEWGMLCKARRLVECQCLILAVTEERDHNMIFVRGPCDDGEYLSSVNNLMIYIFVLPGRFVLLSSIMHCLDLYSQFCASRKCSCSLI